MNRIIITSGGTEEPIDSVRSVSNFSTGRTGAFLAEYFAEKGYEVSLWRSYRAVKPSVSGVKQKEFQTFQDLLSLMDNHLPLLKESFLFIHAAAVSDYHVKEIRKNDRLIEGGGQAGKISGEEELHLILAPNIKLLPRIKELNKRAVVCAFKLTDSITLPEEKAAVEKLFKKGSADLVIHNDLKNVSSDKHLFTCYTRDMMGREGRSKKEMAEAIRTILETKE